MSEAPGGEDGDQNRLTLTNRWVWSPKQVGDRMSRPRHIPNLKLQKGYNKYGFITRAKAVKLN